MRRREPPLLAAWMLRHLTPGDRDEALDGDLLEVFRLGRSNAWYWRQVTSACAVSWSGNLRSRPRACFSHCFGRCSRRRGTSTLDEIEANSHEFGQSLADSLAAFQYLAALIGWIAIHAVFLWAGIVIYQLAHLVRGKALEQKDMRRAFWIAPAILAPGLLCYFPGGELCIGIHCLALRMQSWRQLRRGNL